MIRMTKRGAADFLELKKVQVTPEQSEKIQ